MKMAEHLDWQTMQQHFLTLPLVRLLPMLFWILIRTRILKNVLVTTLEMTLTENYQKFWLKPLFIQEILI